MKKGKSIGLIIILLISTLALYAPSKSVEADGFGDYPPSGVGDWTINVDTYVGNETIILNGSLYIEPGATLTFRNVTLIMNCTSDGEFQIEVKNGASFYILDLDNDNTTAWDASNITAYNPNFEYEFKVRKTAIFEMKNSELHECGYGPFLSWENFGLYIETDNALVDHNLLSFNYRAIVLFGSDAKISNNTIEWNDHTGIEASSWSNGTIENNIIAWNEVYGIWINGWDNSHKWSSNPLVINNTFIATGRGLSTADVIQITAFSNPLIVGNTIYNYTEDAIYFGQWCQATVENLTINADGGNYGLASSSCRNITVTNCSIINTALWDISLATAYYKMTNCAFNQSKVIFQGTDSNLTVNWFLNSYVNDSFGDPIPNANIRIRDNVNGTFDENFTTDTNGYVNWAVLREYFQKDNNGDKDGDDVGEKILYTQHNITASKQGYFPAYAEVQMNESKFITITLQVDEKPEINHTSVASANISQTINITANITDDVGVDAVYLDYTGVNGTNYNNVSMNKWNDNWSYEIPGQNNIGFVDYFIWCNDTSGNANMTGVNQTQINDVTKPEINHFPVLSKNIGEIINITANITDDVSVNKVFLNYTDVHGVNQNITMNKWDGNYSFDIPGQSNSGFVDYFVWCNDSSDNGNMTQTYQILIFDITDPEINHGPVISANIAELIIITANITDDVEIDKVYLNFIDVTGNNYNVSMNKNNDDWSYEITGQNDIGIVSYFVWANDTSGNYNQTEVYQIQINDITKPEIEHTPVTSANICEIINITAQITDDVGVDSVNLNFTDTNGINHNVSMTMANGNWSYIIPGQASTGVIEYFIWCNDTSGNDNRTDEYTIQINEIIIPDTIPPTIISKTSTGVNVSITTTITITFDEPMNISSVQNAILILPTIQISGYNWNADNTTLTIIPSGNLSYNTTYNVVVGTGAKDLAGNSLASVYSWEFTTEIEELIPNGHDDNWLSEYWWVIIIIITIAIIITVYMFQRFRKEKEPDEKEEHEVPIEKQE